MTSPQTQNSPQNMGSTNVIFRTDIRFDSGYIKTIPGIVKAVVIILNLLGFICIHSSAFWSNGRGVYFNIVAYMGLIFSFSLLMMYLFHIVEKYHNFMWFKVEMIGCGTLAFLNLISSTIVVAFGSAGYSAAGFFGYLAMVVYGFDVFLKARAIQNGELAQGSRVQTKQTPMTSPSALP